MKGSIKKYKTETVRDNNKNDKTETVEESRKNDKDESVKNNKRQGNEKDETVKDINEHNDRENETMTDLTKHSNEENQTYENQKDNRRVVVVKEVAPVVNSTEVSASTSECMEMDFPFSEPESTIREHKIDAEPFDIDNLKLNKRQL